MHSFQRTDASSARSAGWFDAIPGLFCVNGQGSKFRFTKYSSCFLSGIARVEAAFLENNLWVLNSARIILGNSNSNVVILIPDSEIESAITLAEVCICSP